MMNAIPSISAEDLRNIDLGRAVILDVRTPVEHDEKHMAIGHHHVPLDQLNPTEFMAGLGVSRDTEVLLLCKAGKRAAVAAEKFISAGFPNVRVIDGGIMACEACGHDIEGSLT